MEHGKEPLVSPEAEWVREYQGSLHRRRSSSTVVRRRRHRRRISPQSKYARRRIVRMVLVSSIVFAVMAASIYVALSRTGNDERSAVVTASAPRA